MLILLQTPLPRDVALAAHQDHLLARLGNRQALRQVFDRLGKVLQRLVRVPEGYVRPVVAAAATALAVWAWCRTQRKDARTGVAKKEKMEEADGLPVDEELPGDLVTEMAVLDAIVAKLHELTGYMNDARDVAKGMQELGEQAQAMAGGSAKGSIKRSCLIDAHDWRGIAALECELLALARDVPYSAGAIHSALGNAWDELGDSLQAIEHHKQHLAIAKEVGDRAAEGVANKDLSIAYRSLKDDISAIPGLTAEQVRLGTRWKKLADAHDWRGIAALERAALALAQDVRDKPCYKPYRVIVVKIHNTLGIAYTALGDYPKAIEYLKQALAIAKEEEDREGEGFAYGNLGNTHEQLGDFSKAIEYHTQDMTIAKEMGSREGEGWAHGGLGSAYWELGDLSKAIENTTQQLAIAKEVGDREMESSAYMRFGNTYRSQGNFSKAIECHKQSLAIFKEIGDRYYEGHAYGSLGNLCLWLRDFSKAIEYHTQSLAIAKEVGDRAKEGSSYIALGNSYQSLMAYHDGRWWSPGSRTDDVEECEDFSQAIEYLTQGLAIAK